MARGWVGGLLLAGGGGLLAALALPSWHWVGLLPVAGLSLVGALETAGSGKQAFFLGLFAGFCHWLLAVSWVVEVMTRYGHLSGPLAALALALMSLILGVFWGLALLVAFRFAGAFRPAVLALGLAAGEVLQGLSPWNFPWNPLAAAFVPWPWTLAGVAVLGATGFGVVARLVLFGAAFAAWRKSLKALALACGAGAVLVGSTLAAPGFQPASEPELVAAIQPNVLLELRWAGENLATIEGWVWELSGKAARGGARWVVWPESAIPRLFERDELFRQKVLAFAAQHGLWLVLNSIGFGGEGQYANSMYAVSPQGEFSRYDKVHLVPFGEYVPAWASYAFLRPLVREVGGFTPGAGPRLLPGPVGPFGPAVCYEVAFPLHAAAQVRAGARVLVTVTNDGWYGHTAAPYQHLALAILRAMENRRFLVRAANTGISAVVDPRGRVLESLGIGERGLVLARVQGGRGVTPAARWALPLHLFPVFCFAVAILFSLRRKQNGVRELSRA